MCILRLHTYSYTVPIQNVYLYGSDATKRHDMQSSIQCLHMGMTQPGHSYAERPELREAIHDWLLCNIANSD